MPELPLILAGGLLPLLAAHGLGRRLTRGRAWPEVLRFACGVPLLSLGIFLLMAAGFGKPWVTLPLCALAAALLWRDRPPRRAPRLEGAAKWVWAGLALAYGGCYGLHALAPEIQPDGMTYHLGLVREYARTGALPAQVAFFDVLPHGIEMLMAVAHQAGGQSAAKLVEFGFLLALPWALAELAAALGWPALLGWAAAGLLVAVPVVGVTATSTYNDVALVFFAVAACWLLWRAPADAPLAGLVAGFCFAIKMNMGLVALAGVIWVWRAGGWRAAVRFAAGAAAVALPSVLRNAIVVRNPLAPLANRLFPNPYFHPTMEQALRENWSSWQGLDGAEILWALAAGGELQGVLGLGFFLLPAGLRALGEREGKWLWGAAAVAALPFALNHGARFLMPALPFAFLALVRSIPRAAVWPLVAVHAVLCWPELLPRYGGDHVWRLEGMPWRAALRLESEDAYLKRTRDEYQVADMIRESAAPGERIFALMDAPRGWLDHRFVELWQSAEGERFTDTLRVASQYRGDPLFEVRTEMTPVLAHGVRVRLTEVGGSARGKEWCAHEIRLWLGDARIYSSPQWTVTARPNRWEAPVAFDGNLASRWRTWEPMRPGMSIEARLDRPQRISAVEMISHTPVFPVRWEFSVLDGGGAWRPLEEPQARRRAPEDLRHAAVRYLSRSGIRYLLLPVAETGGWQLARFFEGQEAEWGMTLVNQRGYARLYRLP